MVGAAFFPYVLRAFRQCYPDVAISVVEYGGKRIRDLILSGDVDVGVTLTPFDDGKFDGMPFADQELALVVPESGKWMRCSQVELADLADEPFVMPTEEFLMADRFRDACRAIGFAPKEVGHSGQWDFLVAMVEAGLGVTLLPETSAQVLKPFRVRMVKLKPDIRWRIALIWRRGCCPSAAVHAWVKVTRDILMS